MLIAIKYLSNYIEEQTTSQKFVQKFNKKKIQKMIFPSVYIHDNNVHDRKVMDWYHVNAKLKQTFRVKIYDSPVRYHEPNLSSLKKKKNCCRYVFNLHKRNFICECQSIIIKSLNSEPFLIKLRNQRYV